jgi:hypothetical protein
MGHGSKKQKSFNPPNADMFSTHYPIFGSPDFGSQGSSRTSGVAQNTATTSSKPSIPSTVTGNTGDRWRLEWPHGMNCFLAVGNMECCMIQWNLFSAEMAASEWFCDKCINGIFFYCGFTWIWHDMGLSENCAYPQMVLFIGKMMIH